MGFHCMYVTKCMYVYMYIQEIELINSKRAKEVAFKYSLVHFTSDVGWRQAKTLGILDITSILCQYFLQYPKATQR